MGKKNALGSCLVPNIRRTVPDPESKFYKLLVRLNNKSLYVAYDLSDGSDVNWVTCFNSPIPLEDTTSGYYLGVTADTSNLYSDVHAVKSLSTWR